MRISRWVSSVLALYLLRFTSPADGSVATETLRNIEYGRVGNRPLLLDVLQPSGKSATPRPAVIFVHGGSWRHGHRWSPPTPLLAEQGYFTASIDYRLSSDAIFPAAVEDTKCAVRWLRANAAKYNVDPDRIGVWGLSAGGHLVEFLGTTADDPRFEGTGGWSNVSSRVACVVSFFGPSNFKPATPQSVANPRHPVVEFLGAQYADNPGLYREASPITYVSQKSAPMLLVHGDRDPIVPLQQSQWMAEAMEKAGAEVRLIVVKNGVHGLIMNRILPISPRPDQIRSAVVEWFDKHLRATP